MILTPQTIKKLNSIPLEVRRWNGNFNHVEVSTKVNGRSYRIVVNHADESLRDFGVMSSVFTRPVEIWYNHYLINDVDPVLQPLVDKMKEVCKMTPEQAFEIQGHMLEVFRNFRKEFYGE